MGTTYAMLGIAFGLPLSLVDYLAVLAVVQLAIAAPSAGGNVGAFQIVMAQSLAVMGVASGAAGAYVIALHALIVVPVSLLGVLLLWLDQSQLLRRAAARTRSLPRPLATPPARRLRLIRSAPPAPAVAPVEVDRAA